MLTASSAGRAVTNGKPFAHASALTVIGKRIADRRLD